MAAFDYIQPEDLGQTFREATKFALPLHEPFEEFERIARNKPHPGIDKDLPKVTDGTLASIIQEKPKRIIQQIPTGNIEANDEELEIIAQHILTNEIIPNADEEARFIAKCWAGLSKAMIYGSQPAFVKFVNRGDYFGTDFVLPYVKDVILEPGKVSDRASNVIFLRTWWSKNQIKALIAKEKNLSGRAKDRGEDYDNGWDLSKLSDLLEEGLSQKDMNNQTPSEKGKMLNAGFIEIVHAFQRGVGGTFYSFSPKMEDEDNILRTRTNPDPRGVIPIHFLYADQDMSNPLGRGVVEMAGGQQNMLDAENQMYQYTRALMLKPPMKKWGQWSKANAKFVPSHIIELGMKDTGNDLEPLEIDNSALNNFSNNVSLIKSQIYNLTSSQDNSISADAGDTQYSKTSQGVKANDARLGVSDNHMRKQYEGWMEEIFETGINLYFAERHGVQELSVDEDTAYKLEQVSPGMVKDNKIRIDYDQETPKLKFKVDASSSDMKDNQTQLDALDGLLERYEKAQILQQIIPQDKIVGIWNRIIGASGVEDAEKLSIKVDPTGQQTEQQQQTQPQMTPEMVQQMIQESQKQTDPNDPKNHPVARILAALNIKGTDMDPVTLKALIVGMMNEMGIQPPAETAPLPMEITAATQMHDQALKAQNQEHQQQIEQANTALKATDISLRAAQQQHTELQAGQDQALKGAQFDQSTTQADRSHQLAEKQANKVGMK